METWSSVGLNHHERLRRIFTEENIPSALAELDRLQTLLRRSDRDAHEYEMLCLARRLDERVGLLNADRWQMKQINMEEYNRQKLPSHSQPVKKTSLQKNYTVPLLVNPKKKKKKKNEKRVELPHDASNEEVDDEM
jgi:hypothetical protein